MSVEDRQKHEFDGREWWNIVVTLAVFAGWTGLVYLVADNYNWLSDGLVATDWLTLGMELGGAYIIGSQS